MKSNAIDAGRAMAEAAREHADRAVKGMHADVLLNLERCDGEWPDETDLKDWAASLVVRSIFNAHPNARLHLRRTKWTP